MSEHAWMKSLAARTEGHRERIFAAEEFLWKHPATGYPSGRPRNTWRPGRSWVCPAAGRRIPGFYRS